MTKGHGQTRFPSMLLLVALLPFVVLCTANSATYRYGASDQAFYIPAVVLDMHPEYFPRDAAVLRGQARLTLMDETIGGVASTSGIRLPILLGGLYVGSLLLLALAAWLIATQLYRTRWAAVALLAALTLRHSISRTGTNTLEGYFHPRQLAFALGAFALAMTLRRRWLGAAAALLAAAAVHPTTAMWFAIWLAVAAVTADARSRRWIGSGVGVAAVAAVWAVTVGPLAGRLTIMDAEWISTLESKNYLFPLDWPATAWIANLAYLPIIVAIYRWRRSKGLIIAIEPGLMLGVLALAVVFAVVLPMNAARVALAVQLQPARMFWMLDFFATIYVVWAIAEGVSQRPRAAMTAAALVIALSAARGGYVTMVEFPDRRLAQVDIPDDDWGRAMAWARRTDVHSGWLADPGHAFRYGTSIRVAGQRDVLVEAVKDAAIGMYDRRIAIRTRDRLAAVGEFSALTPERARALAATYDLDYLVIDRALALPLAFESGRLKVYRLR